MSKNFISLRTPSQVLARESGLKESLPKGVSVQIVVQNPDGVMPEPFAFTRQ